MPKINSENYLIRYILTKMKITPAYIASLIGGKVEGDPDTEIIGFATIEDAKKGQITFLANPKYAHFIYSTQASAVLVNEGFNPERKISATLIRVHDAYSALAELMTAFETIKPKPKGIEQPCFIAEGVALPEDCYIGAFSYIAAGVSLAKGVSIYPNCYIGAGVTIGEGSIIRAGVKIYEGCNIGERCIIHSGAVIGADGFGFAPKNGRYEKIPQIGNVVIADDVEIGANTCIDRATFGSTEIGRGTKLDNLIQIAHNVQMGEDNVFAAQTGVAGSTVVGSRNRVGGQCGFAGHILIGNDNEFGAQSGIPNSVGNGRRMIGYPVTEARTFAKTQVYLKKLPALFEIVSALTEDKAPKDN